MSLLEDDGVLPLLKGWSDEEERLPPQLDDLEFLYSLIWKRKSKIVMEFGIGYSTLVMAKALEKNKKYWDGAIRPHKKDTHFFTIHVVESNNNGKWMEGAIVNIRDRMKADNISITSSPVMIGTFRDMICHYYTRIPNVLPDFIYLDGPDPMQVNGTIRGVNFNYPEAIPMAADLLFIEPILLPGTTILVDGRTSNARFLKRNFQRRWGYEWMREIDMHVLTLTEQPLRI